MTKKNWKLRGRFIVVFMVIGLHATLYGCTDVKTGGLVLEILSGKPQWKIGEDVEILIQIRNIGDRPKILDVGELPLAEVIVTSPEGKNFPDDRPGFFSASPSELMVLAPGETYERRLNISRLIGKIYWFEFAGEDRYRFTVPGEYLIRVKFIVNHDAYPLIGLPVAWYRAWRYECWIGSVQSNELRLKIG